MNTLIYFILGMIAGGVGVWSWMYLASLRLADGKPRRAREDIEKKKENLEKVREFIAENMKVTNDDVEKLLAVSDATATRYLEELEKEGLIRQIGRTGQQVYYEEIKR